MTNKRPNLINELRLFFSKFLLWWSPLRLFWTLPDIGLIDSCQQTAQFLFPLSLPEHHLLQLYTASGAAGEEDHRAWVLLLLHPRQDGPGTQEQGVPRLQGGTLPQPRLLRSFYPRHRYPGACLAYCSIYRLWGCHWHRAIPLLIMIFLRRWTWWSTSTSQRWQRLIFTGSDEAAGWSKWNCN